VHQSGCKTSIIIIIILDLYYVALLLRSLLLAVLPLMFLDDERIDINLDFAVFIFLNL